MSIMVAIQLITATLATLLATAGTAPRAPLPQHDIAMTNALDTEPLERRCNQPGSIWPCVR
jgi:hypothetical protein